VIARGLGEPDHAADLLGEALEYGDRTAHPLLIGLAGTVRGFVSLDRGDVTAAETDARAVLEVVAPHNVLVPAQVGPVVLLASARLAAGDTATASRLLTPIAAAADDPALLLSRRHAVATYAAALLAECRADEAVRWARRATELPAEDVRSRVVSARVLAESLAAAGDAADARAAAEEAVRLAHDTEQASERAAAEALRSRLAIDVGASAT
jgi:tetratricopeptide (TPR) repeat protein